jgi:hypothetical protein
MMEKLVGLDKLTIHQCQDLAQKLDYDGATFELCGPKGKKKATWLDAHFGLFQIEGSEGFMSVDQVAFAQNLWCENLMPGQK